MVPILSPEIFIAFGTNVRAHDATIDWVIPDHAFASCAQGTLRRERSLEGAIVQLNYPLVHTIRMVWADVVDAVS
ncbi:MAG: hypothetical protein E6Q97_12440 [Desulfurellales bacterium]|nr:MAG: hypothetical protein E6Q97_12440 [Desulfurellales bacterium]